MITKGNWMLSSSFNVHLLSSGKEYYTKFEFSHAFPATFSLSNSCVSMENKIKAKNEYLLLKIIQTCNQINCALKFIYSEKATKVCKISTLLLTGTT